MKLTRFEAVVTVEHCPEFCPTCGRESCFKIGHYGCWWRESLEDDEWICYCGTTTSRSSGAETAAAFRYAVSWSALYASDQPW